MPRSVLPLPFSFHCSSRRTACFGRNRTVLILFGVPAPSATIPNSIFYIHQPVFKCTVILIRTSPPRFHPAIHDPHSLHVQYPLVFVLHRNTKSRRETMTKKGRLREKTHFHPPHPVLFPLPTVVWCSTNCHTVPRHPILLHPTSVPSPSAVLTSGSSHSPPTCLLRKCRSLSTLRASCF